MSGTSFKGRTIQVVKDLSLDEQAWLYEKTRRLKEKLTAGDPAKDFRILNPDLGVYLMFLEDSTRTKESFRNAAKFHGLNLNDFDAKSSSFQKKESITDTVKMLMGYNSESIFIIRSRQEGVCRWLEHAMGAYAQKAGLPRPGFINAGDGRHEHPTQEFLDEFSFLEYCRWDRAHLHIALVGDLFHGRTVHSKMEGLRIFREVEVDLVAPPELAMPEYYIEGMRANGFKIRVFESIAEYLAQPKRAPVWYFTRLQLERMGEKLLKRGEALRAAVTFQREHMGKIDPATRFFHPLPRHSEMPTIPTFLDDTPFNAWDEQSRNGYFTRIVEIGMLGGLFGGDFRGAGPVKPGAEEPFIAEAPIKQKSKPDYKIGIRPVEEGLVIDHIGTGDEPRQIWDHISKIRSILGLHMVSSQGVFMNEKLDHYKGIISIPGLKSLDEVQIRRLAAIAPNCTLNIVGDHRVRRKYRLGLPGTVRGLEGICCKNPDCISNPANFEPVIADFRRSDKGTFVCGYCNTPHEYREIWAS